MGGGKRSVARGDEMTGEGGGGELPTLRSLWRQLSWKWSEVENAANC